MSSKKLAARLSKQQFGDVKSDSWLDLSTATKSQNSNATTQRERRREPTAKCAKSRRHSLAVAETPPSTLSSSNSFASTSKHSNTENTDDNDNENNATPRPITTQMSAPSGEQQAQDKRQKFNANSRRHSSSELSTLRVLGSQQRPSLASAVAAMSRLDSLQRRRRKRHRQGQRTNSNKPQSRLAEDFTSTERNIASIEQRQPSECKVSLPSLLSEKFSARLSKLRHSCKKLIQNATSKRSNVGHDTDADADTNTDAPQNLDWRESSLHCDHSSNLQQGRARKKLSDEYEELVGQLANVDRADRGQKEAIIRQWLERHKFRRPTAGRCFDRPQSLVIDESSVRASNFSVQRRANDRKFEPNWRRTPRAASEFREAPLAVFRQFNSPRGGSRGLRSSDTSSDLTSGCSSSSSSSSSCSKTLVLREQSAAHFCDQSLASSNQSLDTLPSDASSMKFKMSVRAEAVKAKKAAAAAADKRKLKQSLNHIDEIRLQPQQVDDGAGQCLAPFRCTQPASNEKIQANNANQSDDDDDDDYAVPSDELDARLERSQVELVQMIGEGQRGFVFLGKLQSRDGSQLLDVAVKTLKFETEANVDKLVAEAAMMRQFEHPHIVKFMGVCRETPALIAMELAPLGEVRGYLKASKHCVDTSKLCLFSFQLSTALSYIESKQFVHRDVAARNVLVSTPDCVKLADFGLSKSISVSGGGGELGGCYVAPSGKMPVRWLAPESLAFRHFTAASDVWMFAVCCWELFEFGERRPWAPIRNSQVLRALQDGQRLERPLACPARLYELLLQCWSLAPSMRPKFKDLKRDLWSVYLQERAIVQQHNVDVNSERVMATASSLTRNIQQSANGHHNKLAKCQPQTTGLNAARPSDALFYSFSESPATSSSNGSSLLTSGRLSKLDERVGQPANVDRRELDRELLSRQQAKRFERLAKGSNAYYNNGGGGGGGINANLQLQKQRSHGSLAASNYMSAKDRRLAFSNGCSGISEQSSTALHRCYQNRRPQSVEYHTTYDLRDYIDEDHDDDDDDEYNDNESDISEVFLVKPNKASPTRFCEMQHSKHHRYSKQLPESLAPLKTKLSAKPKVQKPLPQLQHPADFFVDEIAHYDGLVNNFSRNSKLNEIAMIKGASPVPAVSNAQQYQAANFKNQPMMPIDNNFNCLPRRQQQQQQQQQQQRQQQHDESLEHHQELLGACVISADHRFVDGRLASNSPVSRRVTPKRPLSQSFRMSDYNRVVDGHGLNLLESMQALRVSPVVGSMAINPRNDLMMRNSPNPRPLDPKQEEEFKRRQNELLIHQRLLGKIRPANDFESISPTHPQSSNSERQPSCHVPSVDQSLQLLNSIMADEDFSTNRFTRATSLFVDRCKISQSNK